jgi:hypothetical protein
MNFGLTQRIARIFNAAPLAGKTTAIKQRAILSGTTGATTITLTLTSATAGNVVVQCYGASNATAPTDARNYSFTLTSITQNAANVDIVFTRQTTGGGSTTVTAMVVEYRDIG